MLVAYITGFIFTAIIFGVLIGATKAANPNMGRILAATIFWPATWIIIICAAIFEAVEEWAR